MDLSYWFTLALQAVALVVLGLRLQSAEQRLSVLEHTASRWAK
jgi:hypothetical protein